MHASPPIGFSRKLLKSSAVRSALGFSDNSAFWNFVRSSGCPHIRLNSRNIVFDEVALNAWLDRRTVGTIAA
jgi:hypothetical protein